MSLYLSVLLVSISTGENSLSKIDVAAKCLNMLPLAGEALRNVFVIEAFLQIKELVGPLLLVPCHLSIQDWVLGRVDIAIIERDHLRIKVRSRLKKIV